MADWRTKADQDLTAQDIREMRRIANEAEYEYAAAPHRPPPMPQSWSMRATVRETTQIRAGVPVCRISFADVVGDVRALDFTPDSSFELAADLLTFYRQVRIHG